MPLYTRSGVESNFSESLAVTGNIFQSRSQQSAALYNTQSSGRKRFETKASERERAIYDNEVCVLQKRRGYIRKCVASSMVLCAAASSVAYIFFVPL